MQSRLLTGTDDLEKEFRKWSRKAEDIRIVTAWATTDCIVCDCLAEARSKISTMVVGLDFYTTSPSFLESFLSVVRIGKALGQGTFHPKLYLFEGDGEFCCIMGSSNFTSGGFASNTELNICIEGKASDAFFGEVRSFVEDQEKQSKSITTPELADYREQFERLKESRARLSKFHAGADAKAKAKAVRDRESSGSAPPAQLNKAWAEFVEIILAGKRNGRVVGGTKDEPGYLQTAERCGALFEKYGRLARMPEADRQFVGGVIRESGWFGSMKGAGEFWRRLNDDPTSLDAALDHVPRTGTMDKSAFDALAANYKWKRAGVGTASRLAAMKRPDLFICIDAKNRSGIAKAFDVSASSLLTFPGYWDLMQRIWRCPWWRSAAPKPALERRVWNARVALLDCITTQTPKAVKPRSWRWFGWWKRVRSVGRFGWLRTGRFIRQRPWNGCFRMENLADYHTEKAKEIRPANNSDRRVWCLQSVMQSLFKFVSLDARLVGHCFHRLFINSNLLRNQAGYRSN